MPVYKCKMCGNTLSVKDGESVVTCDACGTQQTVHSFDNEKKTAYFKRANALRFKNEFDKASGLFEALVSEFPNEAEAYWGLVLCKYGIEYVDDPKTGNKIPTCHRSQFTSIFDDADYKKAIEKADSIAAEQYKKEAIDIANIQKGILEISSKEEPFDIFICYKETNSSGERTLDSVLAQDIYKQLIAEGYRVFFSRITLEDKLGSQYEPYIFAALRSSKIMIHVTTSEENSESVWVRNEWSRYLDLIKDGQKKSLIPCYKSISPYDLPEEMQNLQGQDMSKIGAMQDLIHGIDKIFCKSPVNKSASNLSNTLSDEQELYESLLRKGHVYLTKEVWSDAVETFQKAIKLVEKCGRGYIGLMMAENHIKDMEHYIVDKGLQFRAKDKMDLARSFADEECLKQLKDLDDKIEEQKAKEAEINFISLLKNENFEEAKKQIEVNSEFEQKFKTLYKSCLIEYGNTLINSNLTLYHFSIINSAIDYLKQLENDDDAETIISKLLNIKEQVIQDYLITIKKHYSFEASENGSYESIFKNCDIIISGRSKFAENKFIQNKVKELQQEIEVDFVNKLNSECTNVINNVNSVETCSRLKFRLSKLNYNDLLKDAFACIDSRTEFLKIKEIEEKHRKKIKGLKITGIVCGAIAIAVSIGFGTKAIVNEVNKLNTFQQGLENMKSGSYDEAIKYYESLGTYNDADKKIDVCKGLKQLDASIKSGSEQDAIDGIKQIVKTGESVTVNYSDNNGRILKSINLSGNYSSEYKQIINDVNFTLYKPVDNVGYTFSHWNSKSSSYSTGNAVLGMNANWSINSYKITYNLNGGTNDSLNPTSYTIETPDIILRNAFKENYQFKCWTNKNGTKLNTIEKGGSGDIELNANFEINRYSVKFIDWDNTLLYETEVDHGTAVIYPYMNPVRGRTQQYTYNFTGWDKPLNNICSDTVFTAQYSSIVNKYTVTFKNYNGSILGTSMVDYGNPALFKEIPTKPQTDEHSYYFDHWDRDISCVKEDFVTTAVFKEVIRHNVTFKDYDGTVLWQTKVDDATKAEYKGGTIPSKPSNQQCSYKWVGWNEDLIVTKDTVFTPKFESIVNKYNVTFKNWNGSVLQTSEVEYGKYASYSGVNPSRERTQQYTFSWSGWDKNPANTLIIDDTVFTAVFNSTINKYTVTFRNYDETILGISTVSYGSTASYTGVTPLRATDFLKYSFSGYWTSIKDGNVIDDLSNVVADRTVYAKYDSVGYKGIVASHTGDAIVGICENNTYAVWGQNSYSILSTSQTNINTPTSFEFDKGSIKQIAVGGEHIIVLTSDGTAYSRGKNSVGQLGIGNLTDTTVFTEIPNTKFKYIAANGSYSAGISTEGYIYLWGWDSGFFDDTPSKISSPRLKVMNTTGYGNPNASIPGYNYNNWEEIHLGAGFAICIPEGRDCIWSFGRNYFGQVGDGTYSMRSDDYNQHPNIAKITFNQKNILSISAGGDHCMALTTDGTVYSWGSDSYGQCFAKGDRNFSSGYGSYLFASTPINLSSYFEFGTLVDISAGCHFSSALNSAGKVYVWGSNDACGVLGALPSEFKSLNSPIAITYPEKIIKIYTSGYCLFALGQSGVLYSHGLNSLGECGIGDNNETYIIKPKKVLYLK